MISITPNTYLYNKSALNLRKYLFQNKYIKEIIDFKDKKVFKDASVYCCITIFTKENKDFFHETYSQYKLKNTTFDYYIKIKNLSKAYTEVSVLMFYVFLVKKNNIINEFI